MKLLKGLDDFQESIEELFGEGQYEAYCDCCGSEYFPAKYETKVNSIYYSETVIKLMDTLQSMPGEDFEEDSISWFFLWRKR